MTEKQRLRGERTSLRRLAALFLVLVLALPLFPKFSDSAWAAETETGCWKWKFTKVNSQSDLPTDRNSWFPVLIVYHGSDGDYLLDSAEKVTTSDYTMASWTKISGEVSKLAGIKIDDAGTQRLAVGFDALLSGAGLPDTYDGDFPYGLWMRYAGKDSQNDDAKMYYLKESKNGSSLYYADAKMYVIEGHSYYYETGFGRYADAKNIYSSKELEDIKDDIRNAAWVDGQLCSPFTIFTEGIHDAKAGQVQLVSNVSGADSSFHLLDNGYVALSSWQGDMSYDYDDFTMYVGTRYKDNSVNTYKSQTVASGQTRTISNASIPLGQTITVEAEATLILKGNVYFNGTIENYGTVIVEDCSLQATHYLTGLNDRTVYGCYRGYEGSSLIVLGGSSVLAGGDTTSSGYNYGRDGTGIELYDGALINNGTVFAPYGLKLSGSAEIVNGSSGSVYVGKIPNRKTTLGRLDSYIGSQITSVVDACTNKMNRKFAVLGCTWDEEKSPIIENSGYFEVSGEWISNNEGAVRDVLTSTQKQNILIQRSGTVQNNNRSWLSFWQSYAGRYRSWQNTNAAIW